MITIMSMYRTLYKKKEKLTLHYPASDGKAADRTAPSADGTAGTGAGEKGKIECSAASQFLFYQAAALYLDAQESWQEALTSCYAIPQKPQQLSQEEIESLFLPESNPDKLVLAVSDWEEQKATLPVIMMPAAILILYTGVYYSVNGLLSWRYHYRDWVVYVSFFYPFLWVDSAHAVLAGQTGPDDRKTDGKRKGCKDCAEDLFGDSLDLSLFGE